MSRSEGVKPRDQKLVIVGDEGIDNKGESINGLEGRTKTMSRAKQYPINPGEAHTLKAAIYDLSGLAAKQALYGIIKVLSVNLHLYIGEFKEILDDARKLTDLRKTQGD